MPPAGAKTYRLVGLVALKGLHSLESLAKSISMDAMYLEKGCVLVQRTARPRRTYNPIQLVRPDHLQASEKQQYARQSLCGVLERLDARP